MSRGCRPESEDLFFDCIMKGADDANKPTPPDDDPDGDGGIPAPVPIKKDGFYF